MIYIIYIFLLVFWSIHSQQNQVNLVRRFSLSVCTYLLLSFVELVLFSVLFVPFPFVLFRTQVLPKFTFILLLIFLFNCRDVI